MPNNTNRPIKTEIIGIRVNADFFNAFQEYADELEVPKSQLIRNATKKFLTDIENNNELDLLIIVEENRLNTVNDDYKDINFRCGSELKYGLECLSKEIIADTKFNGNRSGIQSCILRYVAKNVLSEVE